MERRLPGLLVLGLVSAGADVDEAVQVLIDEGLDADTLSEVETFVRDLELPPSARDRALLLIERTRLLVERATAGARVSRQLKADAARAYTADVPSAVFGDLDFLRHELATPLAVVQMAMEIIGSRRDDPDVVGRMALVARRNLAVASHLLDGLSSLEGLRIGRKELTWRRSISLSWSASASKMSEQPLPRSTRST